MDRGSSGDNLEQLHNRISVNLEEVRARIAAAAARAGRDPAEVTIVVVTKTFPPEVIRAAVAAGLREIGENRVQEARDKRGLLADLAGIRWHLVGHLQRNKAGLAVELFDWIHSVDSLRLAEALERRAALVDRVLPVLMEINVGGEQSKFGFSPADETGLLAAVEGMLEMRHVRLEGLMTVAPLVADAEEVRPVFCGLADLRETLRRRYPQAPWTHLSMGMTDDYEVAVEEGATMVRLGRALLGERT